MGIGQNLHKDSRLMILSATQLEAFLRPRCQVASAIHTSCALGVRHDRTQKKTDASGLEQNDENPWLPKSMGFALVLKVLIKFDPYPTDSNTLNPCFPRDLKLSCLVLTVCQRPIHKAASSLLLENRCPKIAGSIMV
jgi:hypothetical protein